MTWTASLDGFVVPASGTTTCEGSYFASCTNHRTTVSRATSEATAPPAVVMSRDEATAGGASESDDQHRKKVVRSTFLTALAGDEAAWDAT